MTAISHELLETAVNRMPEDALTPARKAALAQFSKSGFPTIRDENWKYTNLSHAIELSNTWLENGGTPSLETKLTAATGQAIKEITESVDAHWIVIANGNATCNTLSVAKSLKSYGVDITKLSNDGMNAAIIADDQMTNFNVALLQDGLRVKVYPSTKISKPLGFMFVDEARRNDLSQARLIVDVEAGTKINIIEAHVSVGSTAQFANTVIQLRVADDACVGFVRIQERADGHIHIGKLIADLQRDTSFNYANFDFGGSLIRNDVVINIMEPGTSVNLHGLYLATANQHIDNHTQIEHFVGPSQSREEYRGILNDRSRCVFNGKVIVHKGADGTDAEQSNHNLLLSEMAEIDTKPELEIYADDVKCAHGATVGQLDQSALFYLRSRGLDRDEAVQSLTRAFAAHILATVPIATIRSYIDKTTNRHLDALINGGT